MKSKAANKLRDESERVANPELAVAFLQDLIDSHETLVGIGEAHGSQTLADLMYLAHAIGTGGRIDDSMTDVRKVVERTAHSKKYLKYVETAPEERSTAPDTACRRVYFETHSVDGYGDDPGYAVVSVDQALIRRLHELSALSRRHSLDTVHTNDSAEWGHEASDIRIESSNLVVSSFGEFWFKATVKHAETRLETQMERIDDLEAAIAASGGFSSGEPIFMGNDPDSLKQSVEDIEQDYAEQNYATASDSTMS